MVYHMQIYVDGGCRRNGRSDAIGAAAAVIKLKWGRYKTWTKNLPNGFYDTAPTSQRAEISAIILALELALEKYSQLFTNPFFDVKIYSDSQYAVNCMSEWIHKWSNNGWINSAGNPVANQDLIREASDLDDRVRELGHVKYIWIPREQNDMADEACNQALDAQE
jgi:ribonuclease HI